jgi:hypothetical protein
VTGASTYSWVGPLGFTSAVLNPTVAAGLPSTGTYTFTATDAGGCSASATSTVVVNPYPSTYVNPITATAFCDGDSATLDATAVPGNVYQWYDGGVAIPGATNASYKTYSSGNFKVEVTDINGCSAITPTGLPVVELNNPPVTPAGPLLLCIGDNGNLTVNTNGVTSGITFQWQRDGVNIPGAVSASHVASTSGLYKVIITVPSTGCVASSPDVTVVVNSYPVPVITPTGTSLTTAGVYAFYQWFVNTVSIPGATSSVYTPSAGGSYRVRVTDANGCSAYSGAYPIYTTGVGDLNTSGIRLYPNPANDLLRIESPFPVQAVISGMDGRVLGSHNNVTEINLSKYPTGLYLVTIYNEAGERIAVEKVTKQ